MRKSVLRYLKDKVIPVYKPTKLGKAITDSMLEYPDDWLLSKYTAKHNPSGIEVWLGNDVENRRIYKAPDGIDFEAANKHLSHGDRLAIEEIMQRLRKRYPEPEEPPKPDPADPIVELLTKK